MFQYQYSQSNFSLDVCVAKNIMGRFQKDGKQSPKQSPQHSNRFYFGKSRNYCVQLQKVMLILFNFYFSDRKAEAYSNKDIILTLPSNISIYNIKWLSMYCISYRHNFGEVFFPENLTVPAYFESGKPVQQGMLLFKIAFSIFYNINQSACSILD